MSKEAIVDIRLIGDHSHYHCGSAAAFDVIRDEAARHGRIVTGEQYDLLVVNGEGVMHHGSSGCRKKIKEIERALTAGRRVMLVNSVWQDNPPEFADLLRGCEQVVVREARSARELERFGISPQIHLDQSFFRDIDQEDFVDFRGAVVLTDFWSQEFNCFVRLNGKWLQSLPYIDMQKLTWASLVRSLQTASLLITGRHHAVYAACKARTPFLALKGNTHKIEGLIETAGVTIPVFESFHELKGSLAWPGENMGAYEQLFCWMEQQPRWRLRCRARGIAVPSPARGAGSSGGAPDSWS